MTKNPSDLQAAPAPTAANDAPAPGPNTLSVHGGDTRARAHQAIPMPIIQPATYAFADTPDLVNFLQTL